MTEHRFSDVGGTPGGLGDFLIGFVMTCVGGYLVTNQVTVVGSYWSFYGTSTFGVTLRGAPTENVKSKFPLPNGKPPVVVLRFITSW